MGDFGPEKLEKCRRQIENTPTTDPVGVPLTPEDEKRISEGTAPIVGEDIPLLWEFDAELKKQASPSYHRHLLQQMLSFTKHRLLPTPKGSSGDHEISLERLLTDAEAGAEFDQWVSNLCKTTGSLIAKKTEDHYRNAVRQFGRVVGERGRPDHIEELQAVSKRQSRVSSTDDDVTPDPADIHYWHDDVSRICDNSHVNIRDSAIIAVTWDTGCRPVEVYELEVKDLQFEEKNILVTIDGKHMDRDISSIPSMPYLRRWLHNLDQITKDVDSSSAPLTIPPNQELWTRLNRPDQIAWDTFRRRGPRIGRRLGIEKPMNLKMFRKSRASTLAMSPKVNESHLQYRFGWREGSRQPQRYKARFGMESNEAIAKADGLDIDLTVDHKDPVPNQCPNCDLYSPPQQEECFSCGSEEISDDDPSPKSAIEEVIDYDNKRGEFISNVLEELGQFDVSLEEMTRAMRLSQVLESEAALTEDACEFFLMTEYGLTMEEAQRIITTINDRS